MDTTYSNYPASYTPIKTYRPIDRDLGEVMLSLGLYVNLSGNAAAIGGGYAWYVPELQKLLATNNAPEIMRLRTYLGGFRQVAAAVYDPRGAGIVGFYEAALNDEATQGIASNLVRNARGLDPTAVATSTQLAADPAVGQVITALQMDAKNATAAQAPGAVNPWSDAGAKQLRDQGLLTDGSAPVMTGAVVGGGLLLLLGVGLVLAVALSSRK